MFAGKLNDCIHSVKSIWWNLTVLVNSFPRPSRVYLLNRMLLDQTSVNKGFSLFLSSFELFAGRFFPLHFLLVLLIRSHLCSRYAWELIILCLSCPRTRHTSCLLSPAEFLIKVHVSYYNISRCCINLPVLSSSVCLLILLTTKEGSFCSTLSWSLSGCFCVGLRVMEKKSLNLSSMAFIPDRGSKVVLQTNLLVPIFQTERWLILTLHEWSELNQSFAVKQESLLNEQP